MRRSECLLNLTESSFNVSATAHTPASFPSTAIRTKRTRKTQRQGIGEKEKKVLELTEKGRKPCPRLFKRFSNFVSVTIEPNRCDCEVYKGSYKEVINRRETTFCRIHCAQLYRQETGEIIS